MNHIWEYIYKNGQLQFFNTSEGYVEPDGNTWKYIYQYKDHLGNIRLSYADNDNDGKIDIVRNATDVDGDGDNAMEIREEKNYYPFGLTHKGYNDTQRGTPHNYGFGGKEEQNELRLEWLDFSARNYSPELGRWMNIDPLAEDMTRHSPYNYAFDNPISFIDPDGMKPFWVNNGDGTYTAEANDSASTLAEDAGITFEEANELVQDQLGENYIDPTDGIEQSDVEVGDTVAIPEQVEVSESNRETIAENEIATEELQNEIDVNNQKVGELNEQKVDLDRKADSVNQDIKRLYKQTKPKMGGGSFSEGRGGLLFSQGRRISKQQKVRDNFIKKSDRVKKKLIV